MNKTSTNSLIFYFDKAKQKNVCSGYMKKYTKNLVLLSRNNSLMLKGLKSVDLKIIQMYHIRLKWKSKMEKIYGMYKLVGLQLFWSGTPTFSSGTPTFCQMGVLNSCFQNPSESSVVNTLVVSILLFTCIGHGNSTCFIAIKKQIYFIKK